MAAGDATGDIAEDLRKQDFSVVQIVTKREKRRPAAPFTTSQMQQQAVRRLHLTTMRTMQVAQQLYEGLDVGEEGPVGLITYMRTDSVRISQEARQEAKDFIAGEYGEEFVPEKPNAYRSRKGAQEAHEAIRPTDVSRTPEKIKQYLDPRQQKLYELIWRRFVASQMKPAELDVTRVKIAAGRYELVASGTTVAFPGFHVVDPPQAKKKDKGAEEGEEEGARGKAKEKDAILPPLVEGEPLELHGVTPSQHFTKPPARYSEASLVRALEEMGIGRPSTYAPIIRTIQVRDYVEKEKGRFAPSSLGRLVVRLLVKSFPEVMDIKFTARMEDQLDVIEEGHADWVVVVRDFYGPFSQRLEKATIEMEDVKSQLEEPAGEDCPECGSPMIVKWGRFGQFIACTAFPKCKTTKPLVRSTGVACPREGCGGTLIERRGKTKRRQVFYGCDRYPECDFSVWDKPVQQACPDCGASFVVEKGTARSGKKLACASPDCSFSAEIKEHEDEEGEDEEGGND